MEKEGFTLPLSLRAWLEQVGLVNISGVHKIVCPADDEQGNPGIYTDPLIVYPLLSLFEARFQEWSRGAESHRKTIAIELSIDDHGKAGLRIGRETDNAYYVRLPHPSADFVLEGERHKETFVEYLRRSFRWGGFPGWERCQERPEKELEWLAGLAPI